MLTSNGRIVNKTTNNQQNRQRAQGPSGHVSRASADSVDNRVPPIKSMPPLVPFLALVEDYPLGVCTALSVDTRKFPSPTGLNPSQFRAGTLMGGHHERVQ